MAAAVPRRCPGDGLHRPLRLEHPRHRRSHPRRPDPRGGRRLLRDRRQQAPEVSPPVLTPKGSGESPPRCLAAREAAVETESVDQHSAALDRAHRHTLDWLASLESRPVPAQASIDRVAQALGTELPDNPSDPDDVIDLLVEACDPGLTGMPSGRFFGFVIGGTHPAALAADWLVSAWDQNAVLRQVTPGVAATEEVAGTWLLDLLGLPASSGVGFATGATTANLTGILAGRDT